MQSSGKSIDSAVVDKDGLLSYIRRDIAGIMSQLLNIEPQNLDPSLDMQNFGFESASVTEFTDIINEKYGLALTPVIFFELDDSSVAGIAAHLYDEYSTRLRACYPGLEEDSCSAAPDETTAFRKNIKFDTVFCHDPKAVLQADEICRAPVAIIGMSGMMPESPDLNAFWDNLLAGRDLIRQVPADRWAPGKLGHLDRGGFMADMDKFDPLFFGISPHEAALMDPQQRLFLETAWKAIEDAGYNPFDLSGSRTGVFVGVSPSGYGEILHASPSRLDALNTVANSPSSLANRVSYFLNLRGPSEAVDTACSSALVAIHRAVEGIRNRTFSQAIAGSVSILATPTESITFDAAGVLSPGARCRTFDKDADGFVRSEGVGAIFLKSLRAAIADKDHIYALIKGSAVNHGGRSNSFTSPNAAAQADLIVEAVNLAGVRSDSIGYIETHGTGTSLGDPIEIKGLKRAFERLSARDSGSGEPAGRGEAYCGLGSVKTNAGHLGTAAGMAGLFKVVLAMKHETLPGLLHFESLNPYIELQGTPFYLVEKTRPWQRLPDDKGKSTPLRAGISAFGIGGTNAHIIVEEYTGGETEHKETRSGLRIFVLSARNEERLEAYCRSLAAFLETDNSRSAPDEVAFTLQTGRPAMACRLAVVCGSLQELYDILRAYLEDTESSPRVYTGRVTKRENHFAGLVEGEEGRDFIRALFGNNRLDKIARLWTGGVDMDWRLLYPDQAPQRISLPSYPFARERYWIPADHISRQQQTGMGLIHPLLHENTSDFRQQRYATTLTGKEFFLCDHKINRQAILPGVVFLEMARTAAGHAAGDGCSGQTRICLKHIAWIRPLVVNNGSCRVQISLFPGENNTIAYEIYTDPVDTGKDPVVYSQGKVVFREIAEIPRRDLSALKASCRDEIFSAKDCYAFFDRMGINYGPAHRGVEAVYAGKENILARLTLPAPVADTAGQYVLHPSLTDSALQAAISARLGMPPPGDLKPVLPFSLDEITVFGPCGKTMWAVINHHNDHKPVGRTTAKVDIDLCDEDGLICARLRGLTTRVMDRRVKQPGNQPSDPVPEIMVFQPRLTPREATSDIPATEFVQHIILICEMPGITAPGILSRLENAQCRMLESTHTGIADRFTDYAGWVLETLKGVFTGKPLGRILLQVVIPHSGEQQLLSGLSGLLKTAGLESTKITGQLIMIEDTVDTDRLASILEENRRVPSECRILYKQGQRLVESFEAISGFPESAEVCWRNDGVYLITGGAGGLGYVFAEAIARRAPGAVLILAGRSSEDLKKQILLDDLNALGVRTVYEQVDVTCKSSVDGLVRRAIHDHGKLSGIIHAAGIIADNFIPKKSAAELRSVLAAKVTGLANLDQASRDLDLDFFVCFSSIAGVLGNIGQADYAAANAFMDAFAHYRTDLTLSGKRSGRTISINWPLWNGGGMGVAAPYEKWMETRFGIIKLEKDDGLMMFDRALAAQTGQLIVLYGKRSKIAEVLGHEDKAGSGTKIRNKEHTTVSGDVRKQVCEDLIALFSRTLKVKKDDLDIDEDLNGFGVDSILMISIINDIEKAYSTTIEPDVIIENPTISALAGYLIENGIAVGKEKAAQRDENERTSEEFRAGHVQPYKNRLKADRNIPERFTPVTENRIIERIAVIGMACRFPQSNTVEDFWQNLISGRNLVTEVPVSRWSIDAYYSPDKKDMTKSYSRWGGFVDDPEKFDSEFFGISERDAQAIDPQHRLLLMLSRELFESAGYTRTDLDNSNTSVWIGGCVNAGANRLLLHDEKTAKHAVVNSIQNMMAARISDFYNLKGASQIIDTACSSSLVAIHQACQNIRFGESDMAVAGGVELLLDPSMHVSFSNAEVLSDEDKSYVFDERAGGFTLGEGAGLVLLKSYDRAVADGDRILAVVDSSAVNNDGHTMGLTVPSLEGQKQVIRMALAKAGISPESIGYYEAHGTGTLLGDPIEIKAATEIYREYTDKNGYCAVGSVKSNMGHLLRAAGVASFIKVVLSLMHKTIPPTLHCQRPHPRFKFDVSPFYPICQSRQWLPVNGLRRAAVSSFGFGGTNCHLILEEAVAVQEESGDGATENAPLPGECTDAAYLELLKKLEKGLITPDDVLDQMDLWQ